MRLYLLRHGKAEAHNVSDAQRRLTPAGVARMERAARVLARLNPGSLCIFSSPRVRSRQTADIVATALGVEVELRPSPDYGFSAADLPGVFAEVPSVADLLCVGHNPYLPMVVHELSGAYVTMKPGGLARLKLDASARSGTLEWLIAPRVFDALDKTGG